MNWPGQETDPAFALPPSRDFDGGLFRRWSYLLTPADALVWLRLTNPMSQRAKRAMGVGSFLIGAAVALVPESLVGVWGSTQFVMILLAGVAAQFALVLGVRALEMRRRARGLVPVPRSALFEEWIDCIAVSEIDSPEDCYLSPELIGDVLLTRTHIIVKSHSSTLIIPIRAFASTAEAQEIAVHLVELAKGPYYFDAQD